MTRDRSAPAEGDFTRGVLEAAIAALPVLLRADGCAILLPSAERNALRGVARRDLSEPQVQALVELLTQREVSDLLAAGRPFLPRAGDGISPALQTRLREEGWPDLIAVPLPGTGRPVGVLALVPEGDGRWTPGRIEAAMRAGTLLATSLRAAVRATEGERRRRQVASLLERLPLVTDRTVGAEGALNQVVAGVGSALGLTHCLGVLVGPEPAFAEYGQSGATPVGEPSAAEGHPMWRLLQTGDLWSFDDGEAPPGDRSATSHLLNGLRPRSLLAVPIGQRGTLGGYLLLLQADRHRRFTDEERRFAHAAALELAGVAAVPSHRPEAAERDAGEARSAASAEASLAAAASAAEVADALVAALPESAGIEVLVLARWDDATRRLTPLAVTIEGVAREPRTFAAVPLGDDLASTALRDGETASGLGTHAMPRPWRSQHRPPRSARALATPLTVGTGERYLLLTIARDEPSLAELAPVLRALALVAGLSLARADLVERAARRERRLRALNEVLLATATASDLAGACAQASDAIRRNLPGVDLVNVWMVDEAGETLQLIATVSERVPEAAVSRTLPLSDESGAGSAARAGASVVWQHDDQRVPDGLRRFMERTHLATLAAIPMRTVRGVSGTLGLGSLERRDYQAEELTFVEALAGQVGGQLELVRAREQAEGERRRLLSLVETLPEGLMVIDRDAVVRLHSPVAERILGVAVEGRSMSEILDGMRVLHPDGRPYPLEDLPHRRALAGEAAIGVELVLVRPDETETPLLVNCRPVRDPQGEVSGAVCVFQDVAPVQELSSLKSDFINTVSHELRTPITTIRGGALTLLKRRQLLDESTQTELLNDIAEESERLHLLVEDLLSLTRSRAGMNVSPEPVVLHRLINRVILELGGRVGSNSLVVKVPADLPPVDVDPVLTQQVIRNLLENAVKFSPRGRQIEVSAEWYDGAVVVSVLDRGSGVPPDDLDRVFEPFYRPDSTVRSGAQGAGLGLAVCRRLIEMQGGRIWAEAREGGGAAFRFTLPVAAE